MTPWSGQRPFLLLLTCAIGVLAYGFGLGFGVGVSAQPQANNRNATQAPTKDQLEFFERKVRPILADRCYKCHSAAGGSPRSSLALDWRGGWEEGGVRGPAIVAGDPDNSLLIEAVRFEGDVRMPPDGKLSTEQVNDLVTWVRMGAPDPRAASPAGTTAKYGGNGKNHWAFKPVSKAAPPAVRNGSWVKNDIDRFVLAKLEASSMEPNQPADKRTLIRRAYYDMIGLPPTPVEVNAFLADASPNAFEKVVDGLLASPHYGERWGRHWLDVARYSDTKGQPNRRREETPFFPYAWTYRDYVIKAFNDDLSYDRFIREQLAADLLDDGKSARKNPATLAALGFLTLGDHFGGNRHDVINDRIDVTSKAFLGMTVTCARCHDHKFDPIPTADYYSLYGVFASTAEPDEAPVIAPPNAAHRDYLAKRQEMDSRVQTQVNQHITNLFGDYRRHGGLYLMASTLPENQRARYLSRSDANANPALVPNWDALTRPNIRAGIPIFQVWASMARVPENRFEQQAPRVLENLLRGDRQEGRGRGRGRGPMGEPPPEIHPLVRKAFSGRPPTRIEEVAEIYGSLLARNDAEWQEAMKPVWEAALFRQLPRPDQNQLRQLRTQSELLELTEPGALARAHVLVDAPKPADAPILVRGQAETPGQVVPRRFLEALSGKDRPRFRDGSGRLELANAIASPANPLTARVIVNRVWQHHFGDGFVSTPDDLGNQSAPPTHPELLDWLATRFMADGWSLKKLHRHILLSAAWQQSSRNNPRFAEIDPFNDLLWRANIRRLEFEPLRDSILAIGGALDRTLGGHPIDLAGGMRTGRGRGGRGNAANQLPPDPRRSVYGFVDRANPDEVLNTFDVATPAMTMGKRYETTVPQQALFLMNSPLVIEQVRTVVNREAFQDASSDDVRIAFLYELFFQRLPNEAEVRAGRTFVAAFQTSGPGPAPPASADRGRRGGPADLPQAQGARGQGRRGGRGAGAPAARPPLSGWQEYAHALLLTNEAAFVN